MTVNKTTHPQPLRRQAWFRPGVFVPLSSIRAVEVLEPHPRRGVQVGRAVLHGTAEELRDLGAQLLSVAYRMGAERVKCSQRPAPKRAA